MLNMKNKLAKRIMAFVLSGAMVMSNMTAFASETSDGTGETYYEESGAATVEETSQSVDDDDAKYDEKTASDETIKVANTEEKEEETAVNKRTSEMESSLDIEIIEETEEETEVKATKTEAQEQEEDVKAGEFKAIPTGKTVTGAFDATSGLPDNAALTEDMIISEGYFLIASGTKANEHTKKATFYEYDATQGNQKVTALGTGGRIQLANKSKVVKFQTSEAVDVTIYWSAGGAGDTRQIRIVNENEDLIATTDEATVSSQIYVSTVTIENPGVYYIGGNEYLFGVKVEPKKEREARTEWLFKTDDKLKDVKSFNKCTINYHGLRVDANNGGNFEKSTTGGVTLKINGRIRVPVPMNKRSKVTIVTGDAAKALYSVDGVPASATETTSTFICSGESEYATIVATGESQIDSIKVEEIETVTITGTVTGIASDATHLKVVFTDKNDENSVIEAEINNGNYTADLYKGSTYTVSLNDDSYNVTEPATKEVEITAATAINITVQRLAVTEITGNIKFPENITAPEDFKLIFVSDDDDKHTPIVTVTDNTYKVNVNVTSFNDKMSLLNSEITFTNKNETDEVYDYTFTGTENIELRDGIYTVGIKDVKYPYKFDNSVEVKVEGAAVDCTFNFDERMEWDFLASDPALYNPKLENKPETEYQGLLITTQPGKFNIGDDAVQLRNGTIVKIPVSGTGSVEITTRTGNKGDYKVGDQAADKSKDTNAFGYENLVKGSYLTLTATNPDESTWMTKIKVIRTAEPPEGGVDPADKHTIWIVGDSTSCTYNTVNAEGEIVYGDDCYYPRYGYGEVLNNYIDGYYTVNNLALSGASSRDFPSKGSGTNYNKLKNDMAEGDDLIIAFGHNDANEETEKYTNPNGTWETKGSFAKSLYDNYITVAQKKGAIPILCTPIVRRSSKDQYIGDRVHIKSDKEGFPGGDYRQAIIDLGQAKDVPVIDLTERTKEKWTELTASESVYLHKWNAKTEDPTTVDNTHLNIYGAKVVAHMLAQEISKLDKTKVPLAEHIANLDNVPTKAKDLVANWHYSGGHDSNYVPPVGKSTIWSDYGIFSGSVFGSVSDEINATNYTLGEDNNSMRIKSSNGTRVSDTEDGRAMYYYSLPSNSTFTLTAKATINAISSDEVTAFGLMARDDMLIDTKFNADVHTDGEGNTTEYVVAGTFAKDSPNCFRRKSGMLTKGEGNGETIAPVEVGKTYDLSLSFNGKGYLCKFADNTTMSQGYDYMLGTIDKSQYIGMFVSGNADITFSDIKLTVNDTVIELDNDRTLAGDGGAIEVKDGFAKGYKYGYKDTATFEVLNDMIFKEGVTDSTTGQWTSYEFEVDGVTYRGCAQATDDAINIKDKNGVPTTVPTDRNPVFKITAVKDSKITFTLRKEPQKKKNFYFYDTADDSDKRQNIPQDAQDGNSTSHTFYMKAGHSYYFFAAGSKVMVGALSIATSGKDDAEWDKLFGETDPVPPETDPIPPETDPIPPETDPIPPETDPVPPETDPSNPTTPDDKIPADNKLKTISISDTAKITIEATDVVYSKKQPYAITVTYKYTYEKEDPNGKKTYTAEQQLTEGLHYNVDTGNEELSSEGLKKVKIKGTGKKTDLGTFINEAETEYNVIPKRNATKLDISKVRGIKLEKNDTKQSYTGNYVTPIPTIEIPEKNEQGLANYKVTYKNNVNVGKASVIIIGQGDYYGTKVLPFTITKTDLSKTVLTITASGIKFEGSGKAYTASVYDKETDQTKNFEYKGAPITFKGLKITPAGNRNALRPREDYTAVYKKNAQAGKATLTIKGANNFSGSIKIDYTIETNPNIQTELDKFNPETAKTLEAALPAEYSSKGARLPEIKLGNGITLKENVDYKVKYGKECKEVTAGQEELLTVTISGAGSYKNAIAKNTPVAIKVVKGKYYIKANTIVELKKAATADKLISAAKITDASGAKVKPADVKITDDQVGVALTTIKVEANDKTNYEEYTILPCRVATKLSSVKLDRTAKIPDQPFDGVNSVTLTEKRIATYLGWNAKDIRIVSYKNNNKLGSATVTIEGTQEGPYYGTRNLKFKIALTASDRNPEDEETNPSGGSTEETPTETDPGETETDPGQTETDPGQTETDPGQTDPDPDKPNPPSAGKKIDVWDFGVKQETDAKYRNNITSVELSGKLAPTKSEANKIVFSETGGGEHTFGDLSINYKKGDRIYADPAKVTDITTSAGTKIVFPSLHNNYKKSYADGYTAAGGWYGNGASSATKGYALIENVHEGDKIVVYAGNHHSDGEVAFSFELENNAEAQSEVTEALAKATFNKFVFIARQSGTYKIYQNTGTGKPMFNRIVRVPAVDVSGKIDLDGNTISGYGLKFINQTDKNLPTVVATVSADGSFTAQLAAGYTYRAMLTGVTGYGILSKDNADKITTTDDDALTGKNNLSFKVAPQETYTYSGTIAGFAEDYDISKLQITMTPTKDYDANPVDLVIDAANKTFSAKLEPNIKYVFEMEGVNDYEVKTPAEILKEDKGDLTEQTITVGLKEMYDVIGGFVGLKEGVTVTALSFTNVADEYSYEAAVENGGYSIKLRDGEYLANATVSDETYSTKTHVVVDGGIVSQDLLFVSSANKDEIAYAADIYVGYPKQTNNYATVNEAVEAASLMKKDGQARTAADRVTIHIAPGTYREQIIVNTPYISFVNDTNEEVLLTWYYGIGYVYYSAGADGYYNAENAYDKYEKRRVENWGTSVYLKSGAAAFRADGITFENSFNRYITEEELSDGVEPAVTYSKTPIYDDTKISYVRNRGVDVTAKNATERATAIMIDADQVEFNNCGFFSSQDTVKTGNSTSIAHMYFKNCVLEGQTDYIFGGGNVVFDACELSWKGYRDKDKNGKAYSGYITAYKQSEKLKDEVSGNYFEKGYLFRNCTITGNNYNNLEVGAGYFGRPWGPKAATTFINTKLKNADMITPVAWSDWGDAKPASGAFYHEYNTTSLDGTSVDVSERPAGIIMSAEEAAAVSVSDYFESWTPAYYTAETSGAVTFNAEPSLTDNGDINVPNPGHTLTVNYVLNGDDAKNDVSTIKWYIMDDAGGTNAKVVKTSLASDKTYKISKDASGKYIKAEVTPETVNGRKGEAKSTVLSTAVGNEYVDPSSGSDITVGDGINIYLAGDSTVRDYSVKGMWNGGSPQDLGSWGEFIQEFFNESEVTVQNFAEGGRSSRSFINDDTTNKKKFSVIQENIGEGDYLFIQFGHNDSSTAENKKDAYTPIGVKGSDKKYPYMAGTKNAEGVYPDYYKYENGAIKWIDDGTQGTGTYCWFLQQYVDMALEKGAIPVIMSPVARMQYSAEGNKTHHSDDNNKNSYYWEAAKQVYEDNKSKGVLFIDAYELTTQMFNSAYENGGEARGKEVMCIADGTHNNKLGGMVEAMLVAEAIQKLDTPLSFAVKAPGQGGSSTTAGKTVFEIDTAGKFTAYEQKFTGNKADAEYTDDTFTTKSAYWSEYGNTKLTTIRTKAEELADSNISDKVVAAPKATSEMSDTEGKTTVTVTLNSVTENAKIYYTDDGTNPKNTDGTNADGAKQYDTENKIVLEEDTTIKAFAMADGKTSSKVVTFKFSVKPDVQAPTAKTAEGDAIESGAVIESGTVVKLATATENAEIRYTMGSGSKLSDPGINSPLYNDEKGLTITSSTTIKAIAIKNGVKSDVVTFTFTVSKMQTALSSLSLVIEDGSQSLKAA